MANLWANTLTPNDLLFFLKAFENCSVWPCGRPNTRFRFTNDAKKCSVAFLAAGFGWHRPTAKTPKESKKQPLYLIRDTLASFFILDLHQTVPSIRKRSSSSSKHRRTAANFHELEIISENLAGVKCLERNVPLYFSRVASSSCSHARKLFRAQYAAGKVTIYCTNSDELALTETQSGVVDGFHLQDDLNSIEDFSDTITPLLVCFPSPISDNVFLRRHSHMLMDTPNNESISLLQSITAKQLVYKKKRNISIVGQNSATQSTFQQGKCVLYYPIEVKASNNECEDIFCLQGYKQSERGIVAHLAEADLLTRTNTVQCVPQQYATFMVPTDESRLIIVEDTLSHNCDTVTENTYQPSTKNAMDDAVAGTTTAEHQASDLLKHLEKILYLLPSINRRSKAAQEAMDDILQDVNIILGLPPNHVSEDDKPCGEDWNKEKFAIMAGGLFSNTYHTTPSVSL